MSDVRVIGIHFLHATSNHLSDVEDLFGKLDGIARQLTSRNPASDVIVEDDDDTLSADCDDGCVELLTNRRIGH